MARRPKPAPKLMGTSLPSDWRDRANWKVVAMLAKIDHEEYEDQASAFERANATAVSDDWPGQWKRWCKAILTVRHGPQEKPFGSDLFG